MQLLPHETEANGLAPTLTQYQEAVNRPYEALTHPPPSNPRVRESPAMAPSIKNPATNPPICAQ